jgi:UDP-N-acetylglucosamine:LPS N-acetylglucosamine transferase
VVLDGRKVFIANSLAEVRDVFQDHELIGSLGCGLIITMPEFLAGKFMGTVKVLHEARYNHAKRVSRLQELQHAAMLAIGCFALREPEQLVQEPSAEGVQQPQPRSPGF